MRADPDIELDLRGLNCPLPILRTKRQLAVMAPGETLRVVATDPHAVIDFQAFCDRCEHELIAHDEREGEYRFLLRVGVPDR